MVLEYEYGKNKLPKKSGLSHLINKTELDNALNDAGVTELKSVFLGGQHPKKDSMVINARMLGESRSGYWMKQKPSLSIYAVPTELRQEIRNLLSEGQILTKVAQWLVELEKASNVQRDINRNLWVQYVNGKLLFKDDLE